MKNLLFYFTLLKIRNITSHHHKKKYEIALLPETHKSNSVNFTQTSHKFSFLHRRTKKKTNHDKKENSPFKNKLERTRPLEVSNFIISFT